MNPYISPLHHLPYTTPQQPLTLPPAALRQDATGDLLTNVVPSALSLGLKGLEALDSSQQIGKVAANATLASSATIAKGGSLLSSLGGAANILSGVTGMVELIANWGTSTPSRGASSGMAVGAAVGTAIGGPGIGTALGAAVGTLAGGLIGAITVGKHRDQKVRDQMRTLLVNNGVLDADYKLQLADGTLYDMGRDGGPRAEFGGRRPYELDHTNPLTRYAISWVNPLIDLLTQGNIKLKTDFVGYFANAALSNAKTLDDVRRNVNAFMQRFGVTDEALAQAIVRAVQSSQIDPQVARAYLNGIHERRDPTFTGEGLE